MRPTELENLEARADGSLYRLGGDGYVHLGPRDARIILDGEFTADELEWLAGHMRSRSIERLSHPQPR